MPPAPCHVTGRQERKPGQPYLVEDTFFIPVAVHEGNLVPDGRPRPIVHAASQLKRVLDLPGSPFKALTQAEYAELQAKADALEDAREEIERMREEIAHLKNLANAIDIQPLIARLDERYAKKSGPKPKAA